MKEQDSLGWAKIPSALIIEKANAQIAEIKAIQEQERKENEEQQERHQKERDQRIARAREETTFWGRPKYPASITDKQVWDKLHPFMCWNLQFFPPYGGETIRELEGLKGLAEQTSAVEISDRAARLLRL